MQHLQKYFDTVINSSDDIKKLRELILTLAMRGKLVPQDSNDEPAILLFNSIQKTNMSPGLGKVNNHLESLSGINEHIPYELPNGWMWCQLGDIGYTNIGLTYSPSDVSDKGIPVLRSNNIKDGKLLLTDLKRVDIPVKESVIAQEGDLLICARNGSKALVGKTAIVTGLPERMAFGAFMAIFRSPINEYLLHFIHSPLFRRMIDDTNTMTINQITQNNLKTTMFPLPPLNEQKRIVNKIEQLMAVCDRLEEMQNRRDTTILSAHSASIKRLIESDNADEFTSSWEFICKHFDVFYSAKENVEELKKAILTLAMQGKLVRQDPNIEHAYELTKRIMFERRALGNSDSEKKRTKAIPTANTLYPIPRSWTWSRLGEISVFKLGKTPPTQDARYWSNGQAGHNWVSISDMVDNGTIFSTKRKVSEQAAKDIFRYRESPKGSLLMSFKLTIGKTSILGINAYHNEAIITIEPLLVNKQYLLRFLPIIANMGDVSNAIKGKTLTRDKLANLWVPLPPMEEQQRIVEIVDNLMSLCDDLTKNLEEEAIKHSQVLESIVKQVSVL